MIADDIATLNEFGYEVLSYKKKYTYYYVVNRILETAEVIMIADSNCPLAFRNFLSKYSENQKWAAP